MALRKYIMSKLTHIDEQGRANMVDVSEKAVTKRTARARSVVSLPADVIALLVAGDIQTKKGPVYLSRACSHFYLPFSPSASFLLSLYRGS